MKTMIFILLGFTFVTKLFGQEVNKHRVNLVVTIDKKIPSQGDINLHFIIEKENKKVDTVNIDYVPGDIFLPEIDFNKLQSKDVKFIRVEIRYMGLYKTEVKTYNYKINFYKSWLQFDFTVLRIYNLDKKENKKIFFPLEGLQYTYEVDSPNGSITRVQKKK